MDCIFFSVIVPLYNKGAKIKGTIDSILSQRYTNFQIVIVDDGSTDNSASYVKAYNDSRIEYYYKKNGGVSSARNYGVSKAKYEWLLFLDADDFLTPDCLTIFADMIEKYPSCPFFTGNYKWEFLNTTDKEAERHNIVYTHFPHLAIWKFCCSPNPRNMVVRRNLITKYGGFDERMSFWEDWEFVLRIARCGELCYTNSYVAIYNQDGNGLSQSSHAVEKEMAFYMDELYPKAGFLERFFFYENLELECKWWKDNNEIREKYREMQKRLFPSVYSFLYKLRWKLLRIGFFKQ